MLHFGEFEIRMSPKDKNNSTGYKFNFFTSIEEFCKMVSYDKKPYNVQSFNPRGCGVFVLHDGSRVFLNNSTFNNNKVRAESFKKILLQNI
jgi:hypothetical protein